MQAGEGQTGLSDIKADPAFEEACRREAAAERAIGRRIERLVLRLGGMCQSHPVTSGGSDDHGPERGPRPNAGGGRHRGTTERPGEGAER